MEVQDITKPAITIGENTRFEDMVRTMVEKQTNSLLVVNDDGVLVGEINMSDVLDAIVPEYLDGDSIAAHFASSDMFAKAVQDARDIPVKDFMNAGTTAVEADDSLMAVAAIAIANHRTHIPVVDSDNRPVGVISRRGVKHLIADALHIEDSE